MQTLAISEPHNSYEHSHSNLNQNVQDQQPNRLPQVRICHSIALSCNSPDIEFPKRPRSHIIAISTATFAAVRILKKCLPRGRYGKNTGLLSLIPLHDWSVGDCLFLSQTQKLPVHPYRSSHSPSGATTPSGVTGCLPFVTR